MLSERKAGEKLVFGVGNLTFFVRKVVFAVFLF